MDGLNSKKKALIVELICFVLLLALDFFTKHQAVRYLKDCSDIVLIPGVLVLRYLENRGAAFGILQNMRGFFLVTGVLFMGFAGYVLYRLPLDKRFKILRAVIVMLLAGAAGNMADRAALGYVVDFIYFSLIDFPIFNVADMYVTVGTFILFILMIFVYKDNELSDIFSSQKNSGEDDDV